VKDRLPPRFWAQSVLAFIAAIVAVITVLWPDWIERAFGVDLDHDSGSIEWELVVLLMAAATLFAAYAWREWRRASFALGAESGLQSDRPEGC